MLLDVIRRPLPMPRQGRAVESLKSRWKPQQATGAKATCFYWRSYLLLARPGPGRTHLFLPAFDTPVCQASKP